MTLVQSFLQNLELETIVEPHRLRNSTAFREAVARKIRGCSEYPIENHQDIVDWLCTRKWHDGLSVEALVIEWDGLVV